MAKGMGREILEKKDLKSSSLHINAMESVSFCVSLPSMQKQSVWERFLPPSS